ncbi:P1 family peptidase, partial [Brevundimonas sp.]|uniref:P1 family peptidase n=1 Tax=Brevundimonas sp. TaxID=1871086 RepID=UPI0028AA71CF
VMASGWTVGAIVAVNSVGSVIAPGGKSFWAAPYEIGDEFGGLGSSGLHASAEDWGASKFRPQPRENTTIACIATDVALTRVELQRVAIMAQDRPAHAPFDGDTLFSLSTGKKIIDNPALRQVAVAQLGNVAADVLARAVARGVYHATNYEGVTGKTWREL